MLFLRAKKSTQTFSVQSFSRTLRAMDVRTENRGRPHQKARFPAAPVMGRNFLTQGRLGVRVRNVHGKSGPKSLCLCCFSSLIFSRRKEFPCFCEHVPFFPKDSGVQQREKMRAFVVLFLRPYPQYSWGFPEEMPEKFRKDPGTLSELFLESPSRVQLGSPKPYNSRHLKAPEHFQDSLPPSTAVGMLLEGAQTVKCKP